MNNSIKSALPELLAPAGSMERLESAIAYGADAVYLGGRDSLNLRQGAVGFSWEELDEAIIKAHKANVKIYYCLNAFPRQSNFRQVEKSLERLASLAPTVDGLIVADAGVFGLAKRMNVKIPVHLSTQANTSSGEAAAFWHKQGASRVNLARELGASDLRHTLAFINEHAPQLETEIFVHGAMCLALSGQCLLSAWLNSRSGNLGACTHPCRFEYRSIQENGTTFQKNLLPESILVEESLRAGSATWEVGHSYDGFSAFWSPHELCLIKYLPWFFRMGVSSLKLEGRMRTAPTVAHMVNVYRTALNDLAGGTFRPHIYMRELATLATRPLGSGFFLPGGRRKVFFTPPKGAPAPTNGLGRPGNISIVAKFLAQNAPNNWQVAVKSKWNSSHAAEIMLPSLQMHYLPAGSYSFENHRGEKTNELHSGTTATVFFEKELPIISEGLYLRSI